MTDTRLAWIAHMHQVMFKHLWHFLRHVEEEELDWAIHPDANSMRHILGHLLFIEEWTADAITGDVPRDANRDPKTYEPKRLPDLRAHYEAAFARTQALMGELNESDLAREIDMLGVTTASLLQVLENHVTHTAGHMYQIRLIRGTHSRANHTDKRVFDPW